MPGSSISMFPSGPLAADRRAATDPHERHWLALAFATRLVRAPFPTAHAIELDVNLFAVGEAAPDLVRVVDRRGRRLWDLLQWFDDDVAWTTAEGRDWDEVRGEIAGELDEVFYHLGFPGAGVPRGGCRGRC
ncbi:hypothetical protein [Amycolatopsis sp. cmx-4-61]|uniref:hypothetical protein n=1 Tax=Amycolatopsis sp. cmx-4-61 TaxID=2790937 RepID=UPI00397BA36F